MNANVSLSDNNILTPLNDFPKASNPPSLLRLCAKGTDPHLTDPIISLLERFDDLLLFNEEAENIIFSRIVENLNYMRRSIPSTDEVKLDDPLCVSVSDGYIRSLNHFTQFSLRRNN